MTEEPKNTTPATGWNSATSGMTEATAAWSSRSGLNNGM